MNELFRIGRTATLYSYWEIPVVALSSSNYSLEEGNSLKTDNSIFTRFKETSWHISVLPWEKEKLGTSGLLMQNSKGVQNCVLLENVCTISLTFTKITHWAKYPQITFRSQIFFKQESSLLKKVFNNTDRRLVRAEHVYRQDIVVMNKHPMQTTQLNNAKFHIMRNSEII